MQNDDDALFARQFYQSALKAIDSYGYLSLETLVNSQLNYRSSRTYQLPFRLVEKQISI